MNKFKPCRKCYNSIKPGFIATEIEGELVLKECECHIKWKNQELLNVKLKNANLPLNFNLEFKDYYGESSKKEIEKLQRFVYNYKESNRDSSLYFYGDNGTQKTTIAYIIGKELLKQNISVFYIPTMDSIIRNFGSFDKTDKQKNFVKKAEKSDLVIIDECFANQKSYSVSDYQLTQLRSFLKNRLEVDRKSIIFISNTSIKDIEKQGYSKTLYNLIKRNTEGGKVLTFLDYYNINTHFELDSIFE